MYKQLGAILLVAGTCIGSGMIALPMVLAKLGLVPSLLLMAAIWFIMYYTSLINLELNLQAGQGLSLGRLGRHFSGRTAEWIGTVSLKLLSYSLLAVFIYGGSSILQELMASKMGIDASFNTIAGYYALFLSSCFYCPSNSSIISIVFYSRACLRWWPFCSPVWSSRWTGPICPYFPTGIPTCQPGPR